MKVALIHLRHRHTGGTERYLNQMAHHLATQGHSVSVLCRSHEEPRQPAVSFVTLRSPAIGASWRLLTFARDVERRLQRGDFDLAFALGRTWTHDVIRLGGGCHATYLETRGRRVPSLQDRVVLAIERRALAATAYRAVITNSEMVRRDVMARYGAAPEAVMVVRNGVDLERFRPRQRAAASLELRHSCGFGADDFVLLFLGSGYLRKGLDRLLEAFPAVLQRRPTARLLIVGHDSQRSRFEAQVRRLALSSRVRFLGARRDVEVCLNAADLYVLPTRYDPFANSTLEALACGLPVVTTTTNGASEILTQHVHGSVLPRESPPEQLGEEILFWVDRRRREEAARAARRLAEGFSHEDTARASTEILATVLAANKRADVQRQVAQET